MRAVPPFVVGMLSDRNPTRGFRSESRARRDRARGLPQSFCEASLTKSQLPRKRRRQERRLRAGRETNEY